MNYYRRDELYHHGILGQKWGVRRYQNKDGTYTEAGKKRKVLFGKENWNTRKEMDQYRRQYIKENKKDKSAISYVKLRREGHRHADKVLSEKYGEQVAHNLYVEDRILLATSLALIALNAYDLYNSY